MNKTVDTQIFEVTVYAERALVARRGVVQLTGQEQELVVPHLPTTLLGESVRVSGSSTNGIRLSGVRAERQEHLEVPAEHLTELTQQLTQGEEEKRQVQDSLRLLNLQRDLIKNLGSQYLECLKKSPNPENMNLKQIEELLNFIGKHYREFSGEIARQERQLQQLDKQLQEVRSQLQRATPRDRDSYSIIVSLESSGAGELALDISYLVRQASWVPLYDLRLNAAGDSLNLSYLAHVKQNSGEDWHEVALSLSTAKPGLSTQPPELTPWFVGTDSPEEGARAANDSSDLPPPSSLTITMPYPGISALPEATTVMNPEIERLAARMATSEIAKPGGIVTLGARDKVSVPSDGAVHKTPLFQKDYPCCARYVAIPRLMSLAYLQTTIANPLSGVTLLPGKANIFRDNTFVGTTQLDNIAPGQEFTLNLGIDKGVKIERDLVERQVENRAGERQQTTYAYRLTVTNLGERDTELTLLEQLPVSRNRQVEIHLTHCEPQIRVSELGVLQWSLPLPARSSQELSYQFAVEHPAKLTVVGLDI